MPRNRKEIPDWRLVYPESQRFQIVERLSRKILKYVRDRTVLEKLAAAYMEELLFRTKGDWIEYGSFAIAAKKLDREDFHDLIDKRIEETFPEIKAECMEMKPEDESKDDFSEEKIEG